MRLRKAAWIIVCICGAIVLLLECMEPVTSAHPYFGSIVLAGGSALLLGSIAGGFLLLSYLVQRASKA